MQKEKKPFLVFPPGESLLDELNERGLTQAEFSDIIEKSERAVSEIVQGKRAITPETARVIAAALGTSAEMWLSMQAEYDLFILNKNKGNIKEGVEERSRLYMSLPIKDLIRRKYLSRKAKINDLIEEIEKVFGEEIDKLVKPLPLTCFKKSEHGEIIQAYLNAWIKLGMQQAKNIKCDKYNRNELIEFAKRIRHFSKDETGIHRIIEHLRKLGVRLIVLPHFSKTRVDGATVWIDSNKPLIIMSLRYDRIDNFYFTLLHEIGHIILHGNKNNFVDDMSNIRNSKEEDEANKFANENLKVDQIKKELDKIPINAKIIKRKSQELDINPGILIGFLQFQGLLGYNQYRKGLIKVKETIPTEVIMK